MIVRAANKAIERNARGQEFGDKYLCKIDVPIVKSPYGNDWEAIMEYLRKNTDFCWEKETSCIKFWLAK